MITQAPDNYLYLKGDIKLNLTVSLNKRLVSLSL
jgi:hypothetical protein